VLKVNKISTLRIIVLVYYQYHCQYKFHYSYSYGCEYEYHFSYNSIIRI